MNQEAVHSDRELSRKIFSEQVNENCLLLIYWGLGLPFDGRGEFRRFYVLFILSITPTAPTMPEMFVKCSPTGSSSYERLKTH